LRLGERHAIATTGSDAVLLPFIAQGPADLVLFLVDRSAPATWFILERAGLMMFAQENGRL